MAAEPLLWIRTASLYTCPMKQHCRTPHTMSGPHPGFGSASSTVQQGRKSYAANIMRQEHGWLCTEWTCLDVCAGRIGVSIDRGKPNRPASHWWASCRIATQCEANKTAGHAKSGFALMSRRLTLASTGPGTANLASRWASCNDTEHYEAVESGRDANCGHALKSMRVASVYTGTGRPKAVRRTSTSGRGNFLSLDALQAPAACLAQTHTPLVSGCKAMIGSAGVEQAGV